MNNIIIAGIVSLLLCLILGPILIPLLKRLKFGQSIRDEGPGWHKKKSGTPTMGGLLFIVSSCSATLYFTLIAKRMDYEILILLATAFAFGMIGWIDDYIKVVLKRNLGLTARQKFSSQLLVSIVSVLSLNYLGYLNGELAVPFVKKWIDVGLYILPLAIFVQLAVVNSVNLTDGIDGLASSITLIVGLFLTLCAFLLKEIEVGIFMGSVTGGCLGFLFFNRHPAKVFMGDTGSLFLGGAVAVVAIALKMPLILIIIGGVYLMETLSVILQVISFKLTGKRIFKMSPIHHHFEMIGFHEVQIVRIFSIATALLCIFAFFSLVHILL